MSVLYTPNSLEKGLKTLFLQHFASEVNLVSALAFIEKSDSASESYDWLGQVPQMQEFIDERRTAPLSNTKYTITNRTYEATLAVNRDDLADNKTGSVSRRIQQMALRAAAFPNKLTIDALVSGTTDLCYDGTAFFGNSHTARADEGSAQDNLLAGTGTTTSAFAADLSSSKAAMLGFLDEAGEPFHGDGVVGLTCVVPVELEKVAREVLGASMISNTSNVAHQGMAELIVSPRLSDANDWYLCRTDAAAKALIFQDRQPVEFEALEGSSDAGFSRRQYQYGVSARYNVGYGFWQSATKTVNS